MCTYKLSGHSGRFDKVTLSSFRCNNLVAAGATALEASRQSGGPFVRRILASRLQGAKPAAVRPRLPFRLRRRFQDVPPQHERTKRSGHHMKPLIGQPVIRQEDARFLRGQGRFVDDVHVEGMLHAALFRSSWPHGRIRKIDVAAAAALPGVVGVFTLPDFRAFLKANPIAHCGDARALSTSCNCRSPPTRSDMSASRWPSRSRPALTSQRTPSR